MNIQIRYGLFSGFLAMFLITLLYIWDKSFLLSGIEKTTWLIFLGFMIAGALQYRNAQPDGFADFQPLLRTAFQIFLIGYFLKFILIYFLFNFYDAELLGMAKDKATEIYIGYRPATDTDTIFNDKLKGFRDGDFGPKLFDIGVMLEVIIGFALCFGIGHLFKRSQPDY